VKATVRNVTTVAKLVDKYPAKKKREK
jgi:hypothetical protein